MSEKRGYTRITQRIFDAVKTLLKGGATQAEAAKFMGISQQTVSRISRAENWDEYVNMAYLAGRAGRCTKTQEAQQETKPNQDTPVLTDYKQKGGTLSANYQINRMIELLNRQNETLTLISNKLAFIVDELTK